MDTEIKCLSTYRSGLGSYEAGETYSVSEALAMKLLADSPGSFELVATKAIEAAPVDKMVKAPTKKK